MEDCPLLAVYLLEGSLGCATPTSPKRRSSPTFIDDGGEEEDRSSRDEFVRGVMSSVISSVVCESSSFMGSSRTTATEDDGDGGSDDGDDGGDGSDSRGCRRWRDPLSYLGHLLLHDATSDVILSGNNWGRSRDGGCNLRTACLAFWPWRWTGAGSGLWRTPGRLLPHLTAARTVRIWVTRK